MTKTDAPNIEKGLITTLKNDDIESVCKEFSELAIDSFLEEGLSKDIPIINSVVGLARAGFSIRDRLFIEKVIRFINPLGQYSNEDRKIFLENLDQKELEKATSSIVLYLERMDSLEKPEMLGKVFESYMKGEVTFKSMMYFAHFIDSVFVIVWQDFYDAIKDLALKKSNWARIAIDDAKALEVIGIYEVVETAEYDINVEQRTRYLHSVKKKLVLTDAGKEFIKVVFGFWKNEDNEFWCHQLDVDISET